MSQGPGLPLRRPAFTAQPAACSPLAGTGARSSSPASCVAGPAGQNRATSSRSNTALASGSGWAPQGVMRALSVAPSCWPVSASPAAGWVCTSALACISRSGPSMRACTASGTRASPSAAGVSTVPPSVAVSCGSAVLVSFSLAW